jgi:hypothetical protein
MYWYSYRETGKVIRNRKRKRQSNRMGNERKINIERVEQPRREQLDKRQRKKRRKQIRKHRET